MKHSSAADGNEALIMGLSALDSYFAGITSGKVNEQRDLARSIQIVGQEFGVVRARHEAHLRASKGRFNLFTILLGIADETALHSKWIGYLLDSNGLHDCGALFLNLFLETLKKIGVQPHSDEADISHLDQLDGCDCGQANVQAELPVPEGRLDLLIDVPGWGGIAIENKIWAAEQDKQIERYARYLRRTQGGARQQTLLLYLTLDGKRSNTAGPFSSEYYRISYREHVLPWIEECLRETYLFININQALQQYKNVISQLTGTSNDHEYMDQIIKLLNEHPAIIRHIDELISAVNTMRDQLYREFMAEFRRQLADRGLILNPVAEKDTKGWTCYWFTAGLPKAHLTTGAKLPLMVEWNRGCEELRVGIGLHRDGDRAKIWEMHHQQFAIVRERLLDERFAPFEGTEWWPLGGVPLIEGFMSNEFIAANVGEGATALLDQITPLVEKIATYVALVESSWPQDYSSGEMTPTALGVGSN